MKMYVLRTIISLLISFSIFILSVYEIKAENSSIVETNETISHAPNKLLKRQLFIDCKNNKFAIGESKVYINGSLSLNVDLSKNGKVSVGSGLHLLI